MLALEQTNDPHPMKTSTTLPVVLSLTLVGFAACATVKDSTSAASGAVSSTSSTSEQKSTPSKAGAQSTTKPAAQPAPQEAVATAKPATLPKGMMATQLALPTGEEATSALLLEKRAPKSVNVGEQYTYEIRVKNLTAGALDSVVVVDAIPAGFKLNSTSPKFDAKQVAAGQWPLGTLQPYEQRTIRITGAAQEAGSLASCTDVTYETSICMVTEVLQPALQLVAEAPAVGLVCDEIPVEYRVTNSGTGAANNVVVEATLPAGMTDAAGRSTVKKTLGTIDPGEEASFTIQARASKPGTFANSGVARAAGGLEAKSLAVETNLRQPVLLVDVTSPEKAFLGQDVCFDVNLTNAGDGVAANAIVEATVPAHMKFVSATQGGRVKGSKVVWDLGAFSAGAQAKLSMCFEASDAGTGATKVTARAKCADDATGSAATALKGIPAVLLEVVDTEDPVSVGENETYIITATNQGSAPDSNIRITCALPENVEFVSATGSSNHKVDGNMVTFDPLASLAPGAEASWRVVVRSKGAANARTKVVMFTTELGETPVEETEATNFYE
jgi:uncharacterized repeat protein (TIGR01451 family)